LQEAVLQRFKQFVFLAFFVESIIFTTDSGNQGGFRGSSFAGTLDVVLFRK
jgi:hypothetical protein